MTVRARLAGFAVMLAAAFSVGWVAGSALGPHDAPSMEHHR